MAEQDIDRRELKHLLLKERVHLSLCERFPVWRQLSDTRPELTQPFLDRIVDTITNHQRLRGEPLENDVLTSFIDSYIPSARNEARDSKRHRVLGGITLDVVLEALPSPDGGGEGQQL